MPFVLHWLTAYCRFFVAREDGALGIADELLDDACAESLVVGFIYLASNLAREAADGDSDVGCAAGRTADGCRLKG